MGFYSFYKILKDMIRTLFGKNFVKILFIIIFISIGYIILSNNGVFAANSSIVVVDDSIFTDEDILRAEQLLGSSIWNNENYDIFLCWVGTACRNGSVEYNNGVIDIKYGKTIFYYDTTNLNATHFEIPTTSFSNRTFYQYTFRQAAIYLRGDSVNGYTNLNNMYLGNYGYSYGYSAVISGNTDSTFLSENKVYIKPIRLSYDILDSNGDIILKNNKSISPYIVNNTQDIENWSFDKLSINLGTYDPYYTYIDFRTLKTFDLIYTYKDTNYTINVDNYLHQVSGEYFIDIPVNALTNSVNIRNDSDISFTLSAGGRFIETDYFELGTYSLVLTSEEQEQINQDSEKYVQSQILEEQQKTNENLNNINNNINNTNEKLNNLDNTINNSNVDNITNDTLPRR